MFFIADVKYALQLRSTAEPPRPTLPLAAVCAFVITLFIAVLVSSIELRKTSHLVCLTYGPLLFNRDSLPHDCT